MSDGIMITFDKNGIARRYSDEWDITIHCESEEEHKQVLERMNDSIPCGYIRAKAYKATGAESTYLRKLLDDWEKENED